jgi:transposase
VRKWNWGNSGGWDATRYMITDEMWAVIEECLAKAKIEKRGRPAEISDRDFLEALLYVARTGIPWQDLPREFGKWDAIYNRYRRWLSIAIDSWNRTAACDLQPVSSLAQKRYAREAV